MPVDLYVGGAEHAVLHLLYSRFWHKVLFDRGYVARPSRSSKLVNQGMILGETEYTRFPHGERQRLGRPRGHRRRERHRGLADDERAGAVDVAIAKWDRAREDRSPLTKKAGEVVRPTAADSGSASMRRAYKMSKSRGNVVNPGQRGRPSTAPKPAAVRDVHGPAGSDQAVEHAAASKGSTASWPGSGG